MDLLLAARTSDLARIQAYQVGQVLQSHFPQIKVQYHFRQSLGDINQEDPLWALPEKGVFTQDFREGLRLGQWDLVVHSWKDLPTEAFPGTEVVACLPRADMRDLFLFKPQSAQRVQASRKLNVFSSSPRRAHNLQNFFKDHLPWSLDDVEFHSVRGNILTRVEKLMSSPEIDGLIVAKAALDRLLAEKTEEFHENQRKLRAHLEGLVWQVLPLSVNPTAAAQGALAIEINKDRDDLRALLQQINCQQTWRSVQVERETLQALGGGCHQKLGMSHLVRDYGEITWVRGQSESGRVLDEDRFSQSYPKFEKPYRKPLHLFSRERSKSSPQIPSNINAHFVARSFALPEGFKLPTNHLLWTAGLKTWRDLAQRGYWVNGSSESLGEHEDFRLKELAPQASWLKWTHQDSLECDWAEVVSTYKLNPQDVDDDLSNFKEFFWMSGSQFQEAIKRFPNLIQARHFCGPGKTYSKIKQILAQHGSKEEPMVLPSYQDWLSRS